MKALVIPRFGGAEVLRIEERPAPRPGPGEVAVAVRAAGVNFADVLCRLGIYAAAPPPPFVPGIEIAGTVESLGDGVTALRPGDRVMGFSRFGGCAEVVVTNPSHLVPIPDGVSFTDAAAFPVCYLTAAWALDELGRIETGETVLIRSAAGGVGRAATELALARGARILATVGSDWKRREVLALAPDALVVADDPRAIADLLAEQLAAGHPLEVVLDGNGGDGFAAAWSALAPGGRYVLYGAASAVGRGPFSRLAAGWRLRRSLLVATLPMISANRSLAAFNLIFLADRPEKLRRHADRLLGDWQAGRIQPKAARVEPLENAVTVHRDLQERRTTGKLVLEVGAAGR